MQNAIELRMNRLGDLIDGMPRLIQAGMGAHISCARLANITSRLGALGVVSGIGLRTIMVEEVRKGNREVIDTAATFPISHYFDELMQYAPGGALQDKAVPMDSPDPRHSELPKRLATIGAYIEVMLARKGHDGKVGINVMWKSALTVLPSIYGAMLAGVDALLCGAGVPMELPDIVKRIRHGEDLAYAALMGTGTSVKLRTARDNASRFLARFKPPWMMPVLSNFAFPRRIMDIWHRENDGARPAAFVLEHHMAGGHNAPPRNRVDFAEQDDINSYFDKVRELGVPVYVAGAFPGGGSRDDFLDWISRGAYGLQVGSRFALCEESGLRPDLREAVISANERGVSEVLTAKLLSPTGYPFKYVPLAGTMADPARYAARKRICNRGYLLQATQVQQSDGTTRETYLCPAMPEKQYVSLGGKIEDTVGRVCLCNTLLSTAGYYTDRELPLVTLGVSGKDTTERLTARQVMEDILTPEYVAQAEEDLAVRDLSVRDLPVRELCAA